MQDNRISLGGTWARSIGGRQIDYVTVPGSYAPVGECVLEYGFDCPWRVRKGDRFFLVTEGVLSSAGFTLNGQELGQAGPWATYRFEVPAELLRDHNILGARVSDLSVDFGPIAGRRFDGGLVRDVYLERRPAAFLADFAFRAELADDFSSALCTVAVDLNGTSSGPIRIALAERDTGRIVAQAEAAAGQLARFTVEQPRLWSPAAPNLYVLTVELAGEAPDVLSENVGFRKIETHGRDFYLNGKRLFLKGVCRHEFTHRSGYSPSREEVFRELAAIKHAGFNFVRLVHSPQARCVSRIAAELGLLVTEEPGVCGQNLGDERVATPALECLVRTIKRDRNVPSVFAWLLYNESTPNEAYAVRLAEACRKLDPGCLLGMADNSWKPDIIKAMAAAAGLSFYGINPYYLWPKEYCDWMKALDDRPLVFTEWGGWFGEGNMRSLADHCATLTRHSREGESVRLAGCSFWAWADYEEHSRPAPAAVDGWTVEGLVDANGIPRPALQLLSTMCFEIDHPPLPQLPPIEVLAQAPRRAESWLPVALDSITAGQADLARLVDDVRRQYRQTQGEYTGADAKLPLLPRFGRLLVDGIEFACRDIATPLAPLLLGPGCDELVIPVNRIVKSIAVLGHVAMRNGYPAPGPTVPTPGAMAPEAGPSLGALAAEYVFEFEDGTVTQPLRHGIELLRSNNICRWWTPAPRAAETRPAVRSVIDKSYEDLRFDLWERHFAESRHLNNLRWRLNDPNAILAILAISTC